MSEPGKERRFCPQSAAAYLRRRAQQASAATSHEAAPNPKPRRPATARRRGFGAGRSVRQPVASSVAGAALPSARLAEGRADVARASRAAMFFCDWAARLMVVS